MLVACGRSRVGRACLCWCLIFRTTRRLPLTGIVNTFRARFRGHRRACGGGRSYPRSTLFPAHCSTLFLFWPPHILKPIRTVVHLRGHNPMAYFLPRARARAQFPTCHGREQVRTHARSAANREAPTRAENRQESGGGGARAEGQGAPEGEMQAPNLTRRDTRVYK